MTSIVKDIDYIRDCILEGTSSIISKRLLLFVEHDSLGVYTAPVDNFPYEYRFCNIKLKNYRILCGVKDTEDTELLIFSRDYLKKLF